METKKEKIALILIIVLVSGGVTYISFVLYNFYNVVARALLGLAILYLLYKTIRTPHKPIAWLIVDIDNLDKSSFGRYLVSSILLSVMGALSFFSIANLLRWIIAGL
ncbi:MAG: hypothetical protein KJZ77_17405 [Anaerolineales bacterium]|nr:hypothetical protein [Anaerolineales bacterium]